MSAEEDYGVATADAVDCLYAPAPWAFAEERQADIDRLWAAALAARPQMFNGRVLMLTRGVLERDGGQAVFRGACTDVDFKAFLAWRDLGRPGHGMRNIFGMAALQGADGAFVLGEMGAHTANAGLVYFPSGTPDLGDVVEGRVDIAGSIRRELGEETGLDLSHLTFDPALTLIDDPFRVAVLQRARSPLDAATLAATIEATLASQVEPELARMHIARSPADITPAMPPFVALYLRRAFATEA